MRTPTNPLDDFGRLRAFIVITVTLVWAVNLLAPLFVPTYSSNLAANGPLLLVIGAVLATRKPGSKDES